MKRKEAGNKEPAAEWAESHVCLEIGFNWKYTFERFVFRINSRQHPPIRRLVLWIIKCIVNWMFFWKRSGVECELRWCRFRWMWSERRTSRARGKRNRKFILADFLSINHDKSHESVAISFNVMKIFDYFTARISAPALVKYDSINLYLCNISKPQQYLVGI